ncbi:conserved hypothetical protein [delta proteobacterium NaphS2]|nr:conserved hypothetical protein [delta proteobacterium NaphS2]
MILFPGDWCFLFLAVSVIFAWPNPFFCTSCLLVGTYAEIRQLQPAQSRSIKFPQSREDTK